MSTEPGFAFLLPFIFISFGGVLIALGLSGSKAATRWGLGYLAASGGFLTPWALTGLTPPVQASVADAFFIVAAYLNSEALFVHFGVERFRRARRLFAALGYVGTILAVHVFESLSLELLIADLAFVGLMASPLPFVFRRRRALQDNVLIGATAAVALNTVVRNIVLVAMANPGEIDSFASSQYAYFMQASDGVLGMLLALSAIASILLRQIAFFRDAADRDPLTQLLNRRGFERRVQHRPGLRGTIVVCDIDHFKVVNDIYGHATGDRVLAACALILQVIAPTGGIVARFGGEEFVICLREVEGRDAMKWAESMRVAVADYDWHAIGVSGSITASFGVGEISPSDGSIHEAISRADHGLYEAKASGRNRVADGRPAAASAPALRLVPRN